MDIEKYDLCSMKTSHKALRVRDSSGKPGAPSSARGLAAPRYVSGSPTALPPNANSGVNAGTPKKTMRTSVDLPFNSLEFEGIGNAAGRNSELSRHD